MSRESLLFNLDQDAALRPKLRLGDRIWWDHRELGRCVGVVCGVYPRGVTARRDGVTWRSKPHFLRFDLVHRMRPNMAIGGAA